MEKQDSTRRMWLIPLMIMLGIGVSAVSGYISWPAHGEQSDPDEERTEALYQRLAPATVAISAVYAPDHVPSVAPTLGVGAGFLLDQEGTVVTNVHVVDNAALVIVTLYDGRRVQAEPLVLDPFNDVAVLRIQATVGPFATVSLGDSGRLRVGQKTFVVGSPFGLGFTLTSGIVSGLGPSVEPAEHDRARLIQTSAPINPGNSGGPLVDSRGAVIGIVAEKVGDAQNIGFAIPINTAKEVLDRLKTNTESGDRGSA